MAGRSLQALALAALVAAAGCGRGAGDALCRDPLILDQMVGESLWLADAASGVAVRLLEPHRVEVDDGAVTCRATWRAQGPPARLAPVLEYGYPFTLPAARRAFDAATGLPPARIEAAGDYLHARAAAGRAVAEPMRLSAPVTYRVVRDGRPFLIDWGFASDAIAAEAGRRFAAAVAAERAHERQETLAQAQARGFDSIAAMQRAETEARAARERLRDARAARNAAADRLDALQREREAVAQALAEGTGKAERLAAGLERGRAEAADWSARIRRESFARDNDRLEFSETGVRTGVSPFGTEEQTVDTTVVNFSNQTYYGADMHVVIWHAGVGRLFEDRSMPVYFGEDGLSPGESQRLRISLNGEPGIGLAFTGEAFRSDGERHAFLFVNALENEHGKPVYAARWRSPAADRQAEARALRTLRAERAELRERLAELDRRIAAQERALAEAQAQVTRLEAALPPLPSEMGTGS